LDTNLNDKAKMKTNMETKEIPQSHSNFFIIINDYIVHPLNEGFFGFGIFLSILSGFKFISYLAGSLNSFVIDDKDLVLSSLGFICLFLLDILKNFNEKKK
jgi:hypothetical protein